ncbi:MAG: M23 family metallopeptidase [Clostridia bacterium]
MNTNNIKAPNQLKEKTMKRMLTQNRSSNKKHLKYVTIALALPVLFSISALAYSLFSGIDGDKLALDSNYKGNGIVEITVENLANKDLHFDETFRLEQWSTSEQIFELEQDMPVIKSGENSVITIEIPHEYIAVLEEPLFDSDHYIFWLTTNNFVNGQSWMASISFSDNIPTTQDKLASSPIVPVEDNTNQDDITIIKNNFKFQNPITKIDISQEYNSFGVGDDGYFHSDIDLIADLGDEISPFADGIVIDTGFQPYDGLYIVIDHSNGLISKYSHCSEILKDIGDAVTLNDVIALVGQTGSATGPHLAFSLYLNDLPVNPQHFLN